MPQKVIKNDIKIAILHDEGQIGRDWKKFIEDLFTVDLPEECRELGLDIITESIEKLNDENINNILLCVWRLFLFSRRMLQALQDESSQLYKSDLFDTDADKNIVLILGGEDDLKFVEDVKQTLFRFADHDSFHLIQATSTEKIFNSVITIVSPLSIVFHPDILSANDREQHITLIANKAYPANSDAKYLVEFKDGDNAEMVEATLYNPYTLVLENPGHSPGFAEVNVFLAFGENGSGSMKQLGETLQVWFQSELDKVHSILEKNANPYNFLCQALNLKESDSKANEAVDKVLTESFQKHIPEDQLTRVFGNDQGVGAENADTARNEYAPTLLHFAALHGLRNLTALLLRCPGSVRAFGTANKDGDFPTTLAEKAGHWDLKDYMNSYMEVSAMVNYELGSSQQTSQMMSSIVTGQYYLSFNGAEAESYYESINSAKSGDNSTPGYLRMKPLVGDQELPCYDSPFIVPIPVAEETPNYESMLKQMIESEDTYMSFEPGDVFQEEPFTPGTYNMANDSLPPKIPSRDKNPYRPHSASSIAMGTPPVPPNPKMKSGAERVSYEALNVPKLMSYLSPAQQELISLQQKVKKGDLTTNQAVLRFKEWERKHKEQAASFQFQQECLQRIRQSLMKSKEEKRNRGESGDIEISGPIKAGSSTYDMVLMKTHNQADPKEAWPQRMTSSASSRRPLSQESLDSFVGSPRGESPGFQPRRFGSSFSRASTKSFRSNSSLSSAGDGPAAHAPPMPMHMPTTNYPMHVPRGDMASAIRRSLTRGPPPVPPRDGAPATGSSDAPVVPPRSPFY